MQEEHKVRIGKTLKQMMEDDVRIEKAVRVIENGISPVLECEARYDDSAIEFIISFRRFRMFDFVERPFAVLRIHFGHVFAEDAEDRLVFCAQRGMADAVSELMDQTLKVEVEWLNGGANADLSEEIIEWMDSDLKF